MEETWNIETYPFLSMRGKIDVLMNKILTISNRFRHTGVDFDAFESDQFVVDKFMDHYGYHAVPAQIINNETVGQIYSELDPYGEENWNDDVLVMQNYMVGTFYNKNVIINRDLYAWNDFHLIYFKNDKEIIYTLRVIDENDILL